MPTVNPTMVSGLIVLALAGTFGYHGIYRRGWQEIQQIRENLRQTQELQKIRSHLAESLEMGEGYDQQLAPDHEVDWLIQEVGRIARESNVQLLQIDPQSSRPIEGYTHLAVSLQFESSYHRLGRFLSQIESFKRLIRIEKLEISRVNSRTEEASVQLVLGSLYAPPLVKRLSR